MVSKSPQSTWHTKQTNYFLGKEWYQSPNSVKNAASLTKNRIRIFVKNFYNNEVFARKLLTDEFFIL